MEFISQLIDYQINCVSLICFHSITFAGMHWFYWKFAEGYIIVKYRASSILVIIRKILGKLWIFSTLSPLGIGASIRTSVFFFPFSYQMVHPLTGDTSDSRNSSFSIKPYVVGTRRGCVLCIDNCTQFGISFFSFITKTCLYNIDPLKPHFYTLFFLFLLQNIDCVLVRTASSKWF